jgi:hypothetical protein
VKSRRLGLRAILIGIVLGVTARVLGILHARRAVSVLFGRS